MFSVGRLLGSWVWWGLGAVGTAESGFLEDAGPAPPKESAKAWLVEPRGVMEEQAREDKP